MIGAAIVIPAWYIHEWGVTEVKLTVLSVVVGTLYIVAIVGLVVLALGVRGADVTSDATDRKISATYVAVDRKLRPVFITLAVLLLARMAYLVWRLHGNA